MVVDLCHRFPQIVSVNLALQLHFTADVGLAG
jgi:hypothetical protein